MNNTIFYSWQSDLPNDSNRGFIESCLKKASKKISNISPFSIDFVLDRDTKNETGTPDIANSIFKKISKAKIFVADISIINSDYNGRKSPNPNVLLELGYASRILGWEKIFCFYNLDYGNYDDLPFDLKQKRPITYSLNGEVKSDVREELSKIVAESILILHNAGSLFNVVDDYVKEKIDTELLTISNHLSKILLGYSEKSLLERTGILLDLSDEGIAGHLYHKKSIGFQIFKNFNIHEKNLRDIADKMISSVHQNKELAVPIIEIISWIGRYDKINSSRSEFKFFAPLKSKNPSYNAVNSQSLIPRNDDLPDRYILFERLSEKPGRVIDFGDIIERDKINQLTNEFIFKQEHTKTYVSLFRDFIKNIRKWLDLTNGEFILDTYHNFEMKTKGIPKKGHLNRPGGPPPVEE
ncbi:MAG: hypothetical protein KAR42_03340 [candidate division Zixibacteria bacterium]|nr:hypothetical protein [candidate division Zixibacteria bacterium]